MLLPQRRWLSTACTLDSARWVWMPTPYSRASAAQPSRNSSVAWFGIVGATPMRTRPSAPPCQRRMARSVRPEQPLGRRGLHLLDRPPQVGRQQVGEARHGLVEDDVGHRRGQHHPHPHVGVGAHHRLEGLVGDRGHRHVEVVGGRAAGLEHLDGADGRREVLVLRRAESIVCRRVGEQVLERPAPGPAAGQVARRVGVGVAHAGQHDVAGGVDRPGRRRARRAPGPTAAMRSPSTRTSARVSAAGVPARTCPPRISSAIGSSVLRAPYFFAGSRSLV